MTSSTLGIVQARMGSTRLPGKVMLPLSGRPMLQRQLERIQRAQRLDQILVATTSDPSDDAIEQLCDKLGVSVFRGPTNDVLGRFLQATTVWTCSAVVRLTADCPLTSPTVIDQVIDAYHASSVDYVSNTIHRTYPDGLDVEVVRVGALIDAGERFTDLSLREHVTKGIYTNPDIYSVRNITYGQDLSRLRWTVDVRADYNFVAWVYSHLHERNPEFEVKDILELLAAHPFNSRISDLA